MWGGTKSCGYNESLKKVLGVRLQPGGESTEEPPAMPRISAFPPKYSLIKQKPMVASVVSIVPSSGWKQNGSY